MGKSETMTIPLAAHLDTQTSGAANAGDRAPRANQSNALSFKALAPSARDICDTLR